MSKNLSRVAPEGNSASFDDFPNELVTGILSRLPVKTIVQSTCVCKRWHSIIKSPALISAQLSHSIASPSNHYILLAASSNLTPPTDPKLYLLSDEKFLSHHANLRIPFETPSASLFIVGSCNGLVCLTDDPYQGHDIYLLNPSIQMYKKLSVQSSCYADLFDVDVHLGHIVMGFGYCEVENDYKVVRILYHISSLWTKAEVYSLRTGKWKIMDAPIDSIPFQASVAFVDGCLYWLPCFGIEPWYLRCFDLKHEVFNKIELPATQKGLCSQTCVVSQKNGSLALFFTEQEIMTYPRIRVCVLGKDSSGQVQWEEFYYVIENPNVLSLYPLGFTSSGRFISRATLPLMISAINFGDLSAADKIRLDPDIDGFSAVDPSYSNDDVVIDYNTDDEGLSGCGYSHDLTVDTNFVESLVLFLESFDAEACDACLLLTP